MRFKASEEFGRVKLPPRLVVVILFLPWSLL
jgi:preprotein translocase subunit Sec61beta